MASQDHSFSLALQKWQNSLLCIWNRLLKFLDPWQHKNVFSASVKILVWTAFDTQSGNLFFSEGRKSFIWNRLNGSGSGAGEMVLIWRSEETQQTEIGTCLLVTCCSSLCKWLQKTSMLLSEGRKCLNRAHDWNVQESDGSDAAWWLYAAFVGRAQTALSSAEQKWCPVPGLLLNGRALKFFVLIALLMFS